MLDRQKRLNEVYEHLHNHFGVHTKGEFADKVKYARAYISSAMNGNEKYLTDKLFANISEAYPGVFNLDYLLTGDGDLLTPEEDVKSSELANTASNQTVIDNLIEMLSRTIRESDDLRVELKQQLAEVRAAKEDLHTAVYEFRDATYRLTQALVQLNGTPADVRPLAAADEGDSNN